MRLSELSSVALQPGGTQVVAVWPSITAGPSIVWPGDQRFGGVASALDPGLAVEDARALRGARAPPFRGRAGRGADRQGRADPQGHDLDRPVERGAVHEGAVMGVGEQPGEIRGVERGELSAGISTPTSNAWPTKRMSSVWV